MAWWEGEALPRIHEVCAPADLRAMDDAALLRRADRISESTTGIMRRRFEGVIAQTAANILRIPVTFAVGKKRAPAVMIDLVSGVHTRTSEVNTALYQLARKAVSAGLR